MRSEFMSEFAINVPGLFKTVNVNTAERIIILNIKNKKQMGYKKTDPCLQKAYDDERLFVLMARDPFAPQVIMEWVKLNYNIQPKEKISEAIDCALEMTNQIHEQTRRKEALAGSTRQTFRFDDDTRGVAEDLFQRLVACGKHNEIYLLRSDHDFSEGIWIEFKKPGKDLFGYVIKKFINGKLS